MGIQLTPLAKGRQIEISELSGKTIAVDSLNWLYQFLSIIRQRDGQPLEDSSGSVTSHLSGIFYRSLNLMEAGVKLVYVFDGKPPKLKEKTAEIRREARHEAAAKWKAARERGDGEEAKKYAMRSSVITSEMLEESRALLDAMGIPWIIAPSEGEALCSVMAAKGDAYAAATQDYDAFLFGCPRVLRNLSISNVKRGIFPQMLTLKDMTESLGITREQLILLGILVGTDYNPSGVKGIGPKKALVLVKKYPSANALLPHVKWPFEPTMQEIFDFFYTPEEAPYAVKFRPLDAEKIKEILCDRHDFSKERIDSALAKIQESKDAGQKSLNKWF
ncbi:MAG TPA: flap endonuclease-1 [archaeon]|nr:flap endonuclease-1 [archaeon]